MWIRCELRCWTHPFDTECQHSSRPIAEPLPQIVTARTISVQDHRWWYGPIAFKVHASKKVLERCKKSIVVREKLGMLKLDICHYYHARMVVPEIVIKFIRLVDKEITFAQPVIGSEAWYYCSTL